MTAAPGITVKVVGAERVAHRFAFGIPAEVRERVGLTVRELGFSLERKVKLEKLEGQVLHRRSGRLARSINTTYRETATTFTSSTGTRLVYGRAWELGFHGLVHVKSFERRDGSFVRAHSRQMNMNARPFLKPALEEMRGMIRQRLTLAMKGL